MNDRLQLSVLRAQHMLAPYIRLLIAETTGRATLCVSDMYLPLSPMRPSPRRERCNPRSSAIPSMLLVDDQLCHRRDLSPTRFVTDEILSPANDATVGLAPQPLAGRASR